MHLQQEASSLRCHKQKSDDREAYKQVIRTIPAGKGTSALFCFRPELPIQYTYRYVQNSEHHRLWIRYTHLALFAGIYLATDANTYTWKMCYEYIYAKKSPGIRDVFIPARMVSVTRSAASLCWQQFEFVECLLLGPCCGSDIARFLLGREPRENTSVCEFTHLQEPKWSSAWCRNLI